MTDKELSLPNASSVGRPLLFGIVGPREMSPQETVPLSSVFYRLGERSQSVVRTAVSALSGNVLKMHTLRGV